MRRWERGGFTGAVISAFRSSGCFFRRRCADGQWVWNRSKGGKSTCGLAVCCWGSWTRERLVLRVPKAPAKKARQPRRSLLRYAPQTAAGPGRTRARNRSQGLRGVGKAPGTKKKQKKKKKKTLTKKA